MIPRRLRRMERWLVWVAAFSGLTFIGYALTFVLARVVQVLAP